MPALILTIPAIAGTDLRPGLDAARAVFDEADVSLQDAFEAQLANAAWEASSRKLAPPTDLQLDALATIRLAELAALSIYPDTDHEGSSLRIVADA